MAAPPGPARDDMGKFLDKNGAEIKAGDTVQWTVTATVEECASSRGQADVLRLSVKPGADCMFCSDVEVVP